MDTPIEKPNYKKDKKKLFVFALIILIVIGLFYQLFIYPKKNKILKNDIDILTVKLDTYRKDITAISYVVPVQSIEISASIGGRVTQYFKEPSDFVKKGDLLLILDNYDFILDITARSTDISEQINNLRSLELNLRSNRNDAEKALIDIEYDLSITSKELVNNKAISQLKHISAFEYELLGDKEKYLKKKKEALTEHYNLYNNQLTSQLDEINTSINSLKALLDKINKGQERLLIKSPIDGQLSHFNLKVGQEIRSKELIGVVNFTGLFYLETEINEYYIDFINEKSIAYGDINGEQIKLNVIRVLPTINNGKLKVVFAPVVSIQNDFKLGQSVDLLIKANSIEKILQLPSKAVYSDDKGDYVYVYNENKRKAIKTPVQVHHIVA